MKQNRFRKHRRVVSLLLAIVMMCTCLAMSASAATTEVQPRASTCPQCGGAGFQYYTSRPYTVGYYNRTQISRDGCTAGPSTHVHFIVPVEIVSRCSTCGYTETYVSSSTTVYCPYGG